MDLGLIAIVIIALAFDYTNGFHDAANAIATAVSTRALTPRVALLLAAVANLAGALVSTQVAKTVGKGIISLPTPAPGASVSHAQVSHGLTVVFAALIGAILWNLVTWCFGLGFLVMLAILWSVARLRPGPVNRGFRIAQIFSSAAMAFGHGLQDAQK